MKEITAYKCEICGIVFNDENQALECEFQHRRKDYANSLFKMGYTLSYINTKCGYGWDLRETLKNVTKDSCFIISHWQGYNKPAYRIQRIDYNGTIFVSGNGGWSGLYGEKMFVKDLPEPHSKEKYNPY